MSLSNSPLWTPQPVERLLALADEPVDWVWDGVIATGDLSLLAAFMKTGKSTLVYPLVVAIARGEPFLGRNTRQGGVLIIPIEEQEQDAGRRLKKLGVRPGVEPIYFEKTLPKDDIGLKRVQKFIQEKGIVLVVLDSLPHWWGVQSENDNAQILSAMSPLLNLARQTKAAVLPTHHTSKYGDYNSETGETGGSGRSIRGGGALFGLIDQALIMSRKHGGPSNQRVLKTTGRRSNGEEWTIELVGDLDLSNTDPYSVHMVGESPETVLKVLTLEPQTLKEIMAKAKLGKTITSIILDELVSQGKVIKAGKGVRGDPHVYSPTYSPAEFDALNPDPDETEATM